MSKRCGVPLLALAMAACSSGSDKTAATAEDLEHADQVTKEAQAQLQENEAELKTTMREMLAALGKSCDRVTEFEQESDTRLKITCSHDGDVLHYVVDRTTNTVEEH